MNLESIWTKFRFRAPEGIRTGSSGLVKSIAVSFTLRPHHEQNTESFFTEIKDQVSGDVGKLEVSNSKGRELIGTKRAELRIFGSNWIVLTHGRAEFKNEPGDRPH